MAAIVPRWEWRTFGQGFGAAEERFAALQPEKVQESDEVYLLSPRTDANVKVREALMDVKDLEQTNPAGLEQWRPVLKGAFPLSPAQVDWLCAEPGVPPVTAERAGHTLDALCQELTTPARGVMAAAVHKRRVRYTIGGCMAEMTAVVADGKPVRTVAIEGEDADRVVQAVRDMGLATFTNTSYPRGLKALLGLGASR